MDNGTDKVYQYDGAVAFTSGNRLANASFNLDTANGNTNPQGIADPPVGASTGVVAAAPVLAGFQAFSGTDQESTLTGASDEQDALAMFLSDLRSPAALLLDDADVKTVSSTAGTRRSSTHDEAVCDIAAELDSFTPISKRRGRPIR